jgi:hypothetical protein
MFPPIRDRGASFCPVTPRLFAPFISEMLRNVAAYLIAFILAPIFGGLAQVVLLPLTFLTRKAKDGNPRTPIRIWSYALFGGLTCIARGFAAIWFTRLVFGWFRVDPTVVAAWVLGGGFALHHLGALRASLFERAMFIPEFTETVGDLSGVILGGMYLLSRASLHA